MENKENKIVFLEDGTLIVTGAEAIKAWNNVNVGREDMHKPHPKLNEEENKLVTNLAYFPEDKNVEIRLKIKSKKDRILAIALYDNWGGAILHSDLKRANKAKAIFKKLFKNVPENLF